MIRCRTLLVFALLSTAAFAERIGTSEPAPSLTAGRVKTAAVHDKSAWLAYLARSEKQMAADKAALAAERVGLAAVPALPTEGSSARSIPMDRPRTFYRTAEAKYLGEIIVSFQTPAGGWSKNLKMGEARLRGQSYAPSNLAPVPEAPDDFDAPHDPQWHYVGTLDNDATWTEIRFLARLCAALPAAESAVFQHSLDRGVEYLLHAQYPNGGWPQVWPLEGGYHDAVTLNDDATMEAAELLRDVAAGSVRAKGEALEQYEFVPATLRREAAAAEQRALQCLVALQVKAGSPRVLTVWAQQYDPLTLEPVSARNFEPAALSAGESASVVRLLMDVPKPSPEEVVSVDAAMAWFEANRIVGDAFVGGRHTPGGRQLVSRAGSVVWPRYVSLTTGKPLFSDRNKGLYSSLADISAERRNGYGWYGDGPQAVIAAYPAWGKRVGDKQVAEGKR
ncbi:MAG: pectate lyase [Acidobacteriaceae bacterium]|nr:pectate lyase [Acidobacteriaceae bacterium]